MDPFPCLSCFCPHRKRRKNDITLIHARGDACCWYRGSLKCRWNAYEVRQLTLFLLIDLPLYVFPILISLAKAWSRSACQCQYCVASRVRPSRRQRWWRRWGFRSGRCRSDWCWWCSHRGGTSSGCLRSQQCWWRRLRNGTLGSRVTRRQAQGWGVYFLLLFSFFFKTKSCGWLEDERKHTIYASGPLDMNFSFYRETVLDVRCVRLRWELLQN